MKTGIERIADERRRQIEEKGYDAEYDERHMYEALCEAAIAYVFGALKAPHRVIDYWPWSIELFKDGGRIRNLEKAGALIAAAIDRLQPKKQTHQTSVMFHKTCDSCPEQYDVLDETGKQIAYVRLRFGRLTCSIDSREIYLFCFSDEWKGCFDDEAEREKYLGQIKIAITNYYSVQK